MRLEHAERELRVALPAFVDLVRNQLAELEGYPGLPVWRTIVYLDGERGREERLTSITRRPVPRSLFSVPKGYRSNPDFPAEP